MFSFCPAFVTDEDDDWYGNYAHYIHSDPLLNTTPAFYDEQAYKTQNMCGNEAFNNDASINDNAFKFIESDPLKTLSSIVQPTLAKDACFRRAGSPCFTDLECAPNRMHSEPAILYASDQFGGSDSEFQFWTEDLVCSQGAEIPLFSDPDYEAYDLSQNRCCREVGKGFTMYSQLENATTNLFDYYGLDSTIQNPVVGNHPSDNGTGNPGYTSISSGEYSRYSIVDMIENSVASFYGTTQQAKEPYVEMDNLKNTTGYQWKTFSETGEKTCCGGGWIRKFSDGSHDWLNFKRLDINFEDFKCLNFTSPLADHQPDNTKDLNWSTESGKLCLDPSGFGCIQNGIPLASTFELQAPQDFNDLSGANLTSLMQGTGSNLSAGLF